MKIGHRFLPTLERASARSQKPIHRTYDSSAGPTAGAGLEASTPLVDHRFPFRGLDVSGQTYSRFFLHDMQLMLLGGRAV